MNRRTRAFPGVGWVVRAVVACAAVCLPLVGGPSPVSAQVDEAGSDVEQELVERYAPIMMLKEQEAACDTEGEQYAPTPIDIVLDNPEVVLRQLGEGDPVVKVAPSAADLYDLGEGFFVDFPGSALDPECIYEQDFRKYSADLPAAVYAHVVQQPEAPDQVFVQYWFYWYFNDWNNKHESDWEGIVLRFDASSVEEALDAGPSMVGYAQHEGGERSDWDDPKLERDGDRPLVYSSAGSHASYYDSGVYLGRGASEGFGCDDTSGPSRRVDPEVILLPSEASGPDDPFAWVDYRGRWGERQGGPFNGPTGPAAKERWLDPASWFDELRSSSVVIPAGDSAAAGVIDVFCVAVEGGSNVLIRVTTSPLQSLVALGIVILVARFFARRTDWSVVPSEPIVRRRRAGQILRAALRRYGRAPHVFAMFGLVYLPAAFVTGFLVAIAERMPVVSTLISLADGADGTNFVVAVIAGSVANVLAFMVVTAIVATHLDRDGRSVDDGIASIRAVWGRRGALLRTFGRSYVIVVALFVSFVGIPWGFRQLVRYQFAAQAVAVEDLAGGDALARSTGLVRGRWWHTALITVVVNLFVGFVGLIVALLLLVAAAGLPLWVFSALVAVVGAITTPVAAIALVLLYGDARAEADGDDDGADDEASVDAALVDVD